MVMATQSFNILFFLMLGYILGCQFMFMGQCLCRIRLQIYANIDQLEHDTNNNYVKITYSNTTYHVSFTI